MPAASLPSPSRIEYGARIPWRQHHIEIVSRHVRRRDILLPLHTDAHSA